MRIYVSCSWCHEMNSTSERWCQNCGHAAHKARMNCDCESCRFQHAVYQAHWGERGVQPDIPPPVKGFFIVGIQRRSILEIFAHRLTRQEAEDAQADLKPGNPRRKFVILEMDGYAPPDVQPGCQCKGNPMRQMLCPFGHMTECHYPYTCGQAQCGHLSQQE